MILKSIKNICENGSKSVRIQIIFNKNVINLKSKPKLTMLSPSWTAVHTKTTKSDFSNNFAPHVCIRK